MKKVVPKSVAAKKDEELVPIKTAYYIARDRMSPSERRVLDLNFDYYREMNNEQLTDEMNLIINQIKTRPSYAEHVLLPKALAHFSIIGKMKKFEIMCREHDLLPWVYYKISRYGNNPLHSKNTFYNL